MGKVVVHVEYCGNWGYGGKYERLKAAILKVAPDAQITGVVGRKTSFEVTLNGTVIFSKLKAGAFPKEEEIVEQVQQAVQAW